MSPKIFVHDTTAVLSCHVQHCAVITWLTHWGRATHICVSKLTIIGSDNGLSPGRRQAIIWTNAGILLIGPLGPNFSEIIIEILTFSFTKMRFKVSSAKWQAFCLGLNGLKWMSDLEQKKSFHQIWIVMEKNRDTVWENQCFFLTGLGLGQVA